MTTPRRFEQDLPTLLGDLYLTGTPDYRDDLFQQTSRTRQRPAWSFPERWLPVELTTTRAGTSRLPWRTLGVVALIALLITAAAAIYVGTQHRVPAPFGVARNGVVAYDKDGLLYAYEPGTGSTRALTSTQDRWEAPWFSPDGTQLLMARELTPTEVEFGVMPATGGEVRLVTPEPVAAMGSAEFSPDGKTVVVDAYVDLVPTLIAIDLATGTMRALELGRAAERPSYRPMDGRQILFASHVAQGRYDVAVADADGSGVTTLFKATDDRYAVDRPRYSPDGSHIAFSIWDAALRRARVYVMAADGTGLRPLSADTSHNTTWPVWSPDGSVLAVERWLTDQPARIAFIDASDGTVVESAVDASHGAAKEWSPDGRSLHVSANDATGSPLPQVLVDPTDGSVEAAPWVGRSYPSWQRLAP